MDINIGDTVTFRMAGVEREAIVQRIETVGTDRCLSVKIPGDNTTRGYRFIRASSVVQHVKKAK